MAKVNLLDEIRTAKTAREIVEICAARGAIVSLVEAEKYIDYRDFRKYELSDSDLEEVAGGGGRINSPLFYICSRFKEGKEYIWNSCANCLHFRGASDIGGTCEV